MSDSVVLIVLAVGAILLLATGSLLLTRRGRPSQPKEESRPPLGREEVPEASEPESAVAVEERPEEQPAPQVEAALRPSLKERLSRSRRYLADRLTDALGGSDEEMWDDLEAVLIQADVGVTVAGRITQDLRTKARERKISDPGDLRALLADELVEVFDPSRERALKISSTSPTVWLVVGVNGTGKTTTIGKLAHDLSQHDRKVALAAADTFRAAADEQLGVWGERTGAHVVKHQPGADPGAVAFDAYRYARAREVDVLIVDTAGRLHTKQHLMDELSKIRRVIEKEGEVHETLLVLDATAGQNGLVQAKQFTEAAGVTGVVLTKLDGTAKGGIAVAIEEDLDIPIKLVGIGEGLEDLEPFDPKTFSDALLS